VFHTVDKFQKSVISHYDSRYTEQERLLGGSGPLEMVRTLDILKRFLPNPHATILDVGGAAGVYAFPLSDQGYKVHLSDLTPRHIEQAKERAKKESKQLMSMQVGDARKIVQPDKSVDAVLFFGPLYHLVKKEDRLKALREAHRVLKNGGLLFAVGITKYASLFDGVARGFITDSSFTKIIQKDIETGQHRSPSNHPHYFTTAFFIIRIS
jgi:ubiquinone/menaquinone biosynthesis C-methylase UbiE